ncbi:quaternary amine ABC transporter ATP-binding protein [Photobacterium minamisatsumaniensis]|uniref:quaternary amine ABC transporter ATP-binding protein n=1 Tax=Photobacterium minamisatsumaniensis TaxID=2910233 RepID=UPI003D0BD0D0
MSQPKEQETSAVPLISVRGLFKVFGPDSENVLKKVKAGQSKDDILQSTGHTVGLSDINLDIYPGEIFVVMGLSGSGKSTLIRHFNRLIEPTEGVIKVEGTDVVSLNEKALQQFRRDKMSMVFQRFGLMPHRTVLQNIAYGLHVQGVTKSEREKTAQYWLETVGLDGYQSHYPASLSGGQQQRVGLARALCTDAEILLMDEAFSALDPLIRSEMQDQLIELQERLHKTIVFITHDLDEALRLGDRIAILRDGEVVQQGKPFDILLNPADDYVEAFVKDVNRARALTVETVMKPQAVRISAETIGEAIQQMRMAPEDYGYYISDDGYQGVITQQSLEEVDEQDYGNAIDPLMLEEVPAVHTKALLEVVIPETLDSEYPLPVINADGEIEGHLSRTTLAEVLSDQGKIERGDSSGEKKPQSEDLAA